MPDLPFGVVLERKVGAMTVLLLLGAGRRPWGVKSEAETTVECNLPKVLNT